MTAVTKSTGVCAQVLATSFKVPSWEIQHFGPVGQLILLYNAYILSLNLKVLKEDALRRAPNLEIPDAPYCTLKVDKENWVTWGVRMAVCGV